MSNGWAFTREFDQYSIGALQMSSLFTCHLKADCVNGTVFPAIRNNRIDFYYRGGKLFSWNKADKFYTHHKYASVLYGQTSDYVKESDFSGGNLRLVTDFLQGYDRIKENCSLYSGLEAVGVSDLYHRFSCAANNNSEAWVLDIEISFANSGLENQGASHAETENSDFLNESRGAPDQRTPSDRIDLVTIDSSGTLRFFEAKHYSNKASLRSRNGTPPLCDQLSKYDSYLKKYAADILKAYQEYAKAVNTLFGVNIPVPASIDPLTRAIIFGFDREQQQYLNKNILAVQDKDGKYLLKDRTYAVGNTASADLATVFRGGRQNWL